MNTKSKLVAVIIAIICYLVITYIYYNFIVEKNSIEICVLSRDIAKGENIKDDDFYKIKINANDVEKFKDGVYPISEYIIDLNQITNLALKDNYSKGTVILNNMLNKKEDIINPNIGNEVIAMALDRADLSASYQIEKGSKINIYYSAKAKDIENMNNKLERYEKIVNSSDNGYTTLKVFSNVKVIDVYNKYGVSMENETEDSTNLMETFLIEVSNEEAILISYLKNYGDFSVTLVS